MSSTIATLGLRVDATGAIQSTRTVKKELRELGEEGSRAAGDIAKLKTQLVAIGLGTAAFVQLAREARQFSDAMAEVTTLLSDTSGIDQLTNAARQLGAEFGKAPTEQAKALYNIISAGAATSAVAIDTLTAANKLAVGGVTDVATAADGLTSILNAYGAAVGSATDVSDALFVAMRAGKTTIGELSASIGKVAPIAANAGVAIEDVLAATAALTKGGISTKESITGLRAILATILKPSVEATEQAKALGIEFNATALKAKGLNTFLADLTTAVGDNQDAMAKLFGGVEALVPVLALTGAGAKDYGDILADMGVKAGQTEKAFNAIADSPGFKLDQLLQTMKDEALGLGLALLETLSPAIVLLTRNFSLLVEGVQVAAAVLAGRLFLRAVQDVQAYIAQLVAKRAALVAATAEQVKAAQAAVANAQAEAAAGAKRLVAAEAQLRALVAIEASSQRVAAAQARVNVETALGAQAATQLAAAQSAVVVAQTSATAATSALTGALAAARTAATAFWTAIGGPIGATIIALFAFYKLFIDTTKEVEKFRGELADARARADEYAKSLNGLGVEALKAAEAQERLNVAALASQLEAKSTQLVDVRGRRDAAGFGRDSDGRGVVLAKEAQKVQAEYNALLVQAEEATARLARATDVRTRAEREAADEAKRAQEEANRVTEQRTQAAADLRRDIEEDIARQRELNAAFGAGAKVIGDINAKYELRAKLSRIAAEFTGREADELANLVKELSALEAQERELTEAKRQRDEADKAAENAERDRERAAKERADADKKLKDELDRIAESRRKGAAAAARANELLDREITLLKVAAPEARKLADEWLFADTQARFLAEGLDAVNASIEATKYVQKTQELRKLREETTNWGEALDGVNESLLLLVQSLDGGAQAAAKAVGALTGSLQLLIKAQETAKKNSERGNVTGRDQLIAGGGAALGGFAAGSAFGGQTSNRTAGTLGGAVSGAASGALAGAALGPVGAVAGAAIGALTGAIGGFISSSKNATQEALAAASAQKALRESLAGLRASLGNDTLGVAIAQARQQFEQLRLETEKAFSGKKNEQERNKILAELNRLEAQRIEQIKAEAAEAQRRAQVDLRVRELRAQGFGLEADALAFAEAQQREYADAVKAGADATTLARIEATLLAEAQQRAAKAQEDARRSLFDIENALRAIDDPIGAARAGDIEEANRRIFDAIERGASEAELAAIALFNAAELARREAERVEADRRQRENLIVRGLGALGNERATEDFAVGARQRQELVDAFKDGISPTNLAILQFVQFAEREVIATRRAIEDGTKAIQDAAANEVAAVNVLIEVARTTAAQQIAAIDAQIAAVQEAAAAQAKAFDVQIAAIRDDAKLRTEALDRQIASAREGLDVAKQQLAAIEKQAQTTQQVIEALDSFRRSLAVGEFSPFSLEDQLGTARDRFDELVRQAQAGDSTAALELPAAASEFLRLSRQFNASNAGFVDDFNRVNDLVAAVQAQFGQQLPIDLQMLEAAKQQIDGLEGVIKSLGEQKDQIQRDAERQIAELQKLKDEAKEDAQRIVDTLREQRERISKDAEETIRKLEETRQQIEDSAREQIEILIEQENARLQTRLRENQFYDTFAAYAAGANEYFGAALDAIDRENTPGVDPLTGAPGTTGPRGESAAATLATQMAEQVSELKAMNRSLSERLDAALARLDTLTQVTVTGTNEKLRVGSRNVEATYAVAQEVRASAQANAARNRPVGITNDF